MFEKMKSKMKEVLPTVVEIGCTVGVVAVIGIAMYTCPVLLTGVPVLTDSMQEFADEFGSIIRIK